MGTSKGSSEIINAVKDLTAHLPIFLQNGLSLSNALLSQGVMCPLHYNSKFDVLYYIQAFAIGFVIHAICTLSLEFKTRRWMFCMNWHSACTVNDNVSFA